jgi:uncharacterized protein YggU (UPF0235/DUF167 family)
LAGYFNVPKSHIHLLKGRASRYKIFDLVKWKYSISV